MPRQQSFMHNGAAHEPERRLVRTQTPLHVGIGSFDQFRESRGVHFFVWADLDVAHKFAGPFQQSRWVGEISTSKEADVHVSRERIHVTESRVTAARGRMPVVQEFTNVFAAIPHHFKPALSNRSQRSRMLAHPGIDRGVVLDCSGKSKKLAHRQFNFRMSSTR